MEFIVPKFIDREPKIIGPFTFKQFIYLLIPGSICVMLYFMIAKKNFALFVLITIVLMGSGLAFGSLKIKGRPLPLFLRNFFLFSISSKVFIWKRKMMLPKVQKIQEGEEETEKQTPKVIQRSRLQKILIDIETKKK